MKIPSNFRLISWRHRQGPSAFSSQQQLCGGHTFPCWAHCLTAGSKSRGKFPALPPFETSTPLCVHKLARPSARQELRHIKKKRRPLDGGVLELLFCNEVFSLRSSLVQERGGMVAPFLLCVCMCPTGHQWLRGLRVNPFPHTLEAASRG